MTRSILRTLAWLVLTGCRGEDAAVTDPTPVVERPAVLLANCKEIEVDGTCVLGPGPATLRVWIDQQEHASIRVRIDGAHGVTRTRGVDGGLLLEIEVPELARSLVVEGVDPRWRTHWSLALGRRPRSAIVDATRDADPASAIATLEAGLESLPDHDRLAALQRLQALCFQGGDIRAAARYSARVVTMAQRLGHRRAAAQAATTAVFIHAYLLGKLAAARPFLEVLDGLAAPLPEAAVWAAFSHGLVARAVGDTTRALESFRNAERMAQRLGMHRELLSAREGLGIMYAELARGSDAIALAHRMVADAERLEVSCSLRFSALNTAGWVQLLLEQRQVEHVPPQELFERALELVEEGGECPSSDEEVNVRINLALTALSEPDPAMALAWLEPVTQVPERHRPWVDEVNARAGLALHRWELVPSPLLRPRSGLPDAERWNELMRQATVLEALGMPDAAIDAYVAAEQLVAASVSSIGVNLGRELFLSGRQASARALVRELVRAGRHGEALCHARLARGRALRMLDRHARLRGAPPHVRATWEADVAAVAELRRRLDTEAADDWRLSSSEQERRRARRAERREQAGKRLDEAYTRLGVMASVDDCASLPRLRDGEVMLLVFPLDRDEGWLVFVSDDTTVVAHRVSKPPAEGDLRAWSDALLGGAAATIERARRLTILPTGRSWDVAFAALPWRSGVLLDVAPVSYALGLARSEAPPLRPERALVVADPKRDLPLARREADRVAAALERGAWTVERLEGQAATRARIEASLGSASLLHYAGHGEYAGTTGWDARLLVGEGEGFGVTDILALPRVPRAVVLSGCETGKTDSDTLEGGMNIGRAFVLAGSEWVVAVDRRVSDALSSTVGHGLYDELPAVGWDGPQALRLVQLRLRATQPDQDWAAFRAIVR